MNFIKELPLEVSIVIDKKITNKKALNEVMNSKFPPPKTSISSRTRRIGNW